MTTLIKSDIQGIKQTNKNVEKYIMTAHKILDNIISKTLSLSEKRKRDMDIPTFIDFIIEMLCLLRIIKIMVIWQIFHIKI